MKLSLAAASFLVASCSPPVAKAPAAPPPERGVEAMVSAVDDLGRAEGAVLSVEELLDELGASDAGGER